jgi:hypothetical protein
VILVRYPPAASTRAVVIPAGLTLEPVAGVDRLSGDIEAVGRDKIEPLTAILTSRLKGPLPAALVFMSMSRSRLPATDVMLTPLLPLEKQ